MNTNSLFNLTLFLAVFLFPQHARARDSTGLSLPEGALARLGKGAVCVHGGDRENAVAWSPDGTRLAVASRIGAWLYDVHTGAEVALLTGHAYGVTSVAFSPDGKTLATGGCIPEGTIRLWDVVTGKETNALQGHTREVTCVAFSPDGTTLASGGGWSDNTIVLWDVATGGATGALKGHTWRITSLSFSPDGSILASASEDGTVLLWDMAPHLATRMQTAVQGSDYDKIGGPDGSGENTPVNWCTADQTVVLSFELQKNGKTASICRDEPENLIYYFGVPGREPELKYIGPILGQFSARGTLWGEGVNSLAELASALDDEDSAWFDASSDGGALARAAVASETKGFYTVDAFTGIVGQGVYIFRRGGWEYAIRYEWTRPIDVEEDEAEDYGSYEITVLSPEGKMFRIR